MSAKMKYDTFKDLRKGKYDWKVQARIQHLWRGHNKKKDPFKSFNILLVDNKRVRVHAFVPGSDADELEKDLEIGKVYLIQNFTVKDYEAAELFRCVRKDIQIVFDNQTKITKLKEESVIIDKYVFDFFDLAELSPLANQNKYLTDVIGVMEHPKPLGKVRNRHGHLQDQIKFRITDGSTSVNVTFWDDFAVKFSKALTPNIEYPPILIIGSGRVQQWSGEINIANASPTSFYLNCNHRSVAEIRKMLASKTFPSKNLSLATNTTPKLCKVELIKNFGEDQIQKKVFCQVKIRKIQNINTWFVSVCTSCYKEVPFADNIYNCADCQKKGSYPDRKYQVCIFASDDTGAIDIMLEDREVRTIVGKTVYKLCDEVQNEENVPTLLKTIENKDCTIKLIIRKENITEKYPIYQAEDLMEGFNMEDLSDDETTLHPIEHMETEASTSSYHLDSLSTLSNATKKANS